MASSGPIPADAVHERKKLACKLGQPKARVIRRALQELEQRVFWPEAQEVFARDAADAAEGTTGEFVEWEKASEADLRDEIW
jgi:predicted transcriptional regulator